jgi:hypothetical protein
MTCVAVVAAVVIAIAVAVAESKMMDNNILCRQKIIIVMSWRHRQ